MNLEQLVSLADGWTPLAQAEDALRQGAGAVQLEGVPAAAKGWLLAALARRLARPLVVVTYADGPAAQIAADLARFLPPAAAVRPLPSSLNLLLDDEESERDVSQAGRRLRLLTDLAHGEAPAAIVATASGLLQRVPPPATLKGRRMTLRTGETVSLDALSARLNAFGYRREDLVRLPGTFARRGDLLDVFPADADRPVRIDLFGDEIESLRPFDPETQRSEGTLAEATVAAAHEIAYSRERMAAAAQTLRTELERRLSQMRAAGEPAERTERLQDSVEADAIRLQQAAFFAGIERYVPLLHPDAVGVLDCLPGDALLVLDEPAQISAYTEREIETVLRSFASRAERGEILMPAPDLFLPLAPTLEAAARAHRTLLFALLDRPQPWAPPRVRLSAGGAPAESFGGRTGPLAEALETWVRNGVRVAIVSAQAPRVRGLMQEKGLAEAPLTALSAPTRPTGGIALVHGVLDAGFHLPDARLAVLSDAEVFGSVSDRKKRIRRREFRDGMRLTSLLDLKPGDYVVHIHHGIGLYQGLTKMSVQGVEKEYLQVQYEGTDRLFVPVDQIDRVQKYIGSEGAPPPLNRLGGSEWLKATARAQRQVREIAGELIQLYAARQASPGYAYAPDTPWVGEMEDAFPYVETPDQAAAIEEVKRDLETPRPMDRLICGDVGYGKTEVAMRAAFKVASEGRQVAVLCPTTVLAAQHYATFCERLSPFPVRIDQLSRFRSPKEQARTLEALKVGAVDIVIGTHRILSKDVEFKDLGLVVVDEEQRFGVVHKERLKQLRQTVDVLTMTATPIPRTLHMSLSGIRDMSLINDPPEGRTPIKTYIKEYDDALVREAILREVDRGGQVYFVHNRIESIYHVAHHLERLVPTARFKIGHGQMSEDDLEETMLAFYQRQFDVLICTTIVESGLDIPNVNTILIDHADKMGLAQLYQLRGRVGRSRVQAYAYLLYPHAKRLTTVAEQRLEALREFADLGSGYKIALRDLELRGAGNLLGAEQSGMVASVGFDLYLQLLEQAIHEGKGEAPDKAQVPLPAVDLPIAATVPEKYIPSEPQRILMYKKLAAVRDRADVARLQEEFEDRFGDPPATVWNALNLLRLRLRCQEVGIESVGVDSGKAILRFQAGTRLPGSTLRPLTVAYRAQGHAFHPERVEMRLPSASKILAGVEEMVEVLARALTEPPPPRTTPGGAEKRRNVTPREPGWR